MSAAWIGSTLPVPCATPITSRFGRDASRGTLVSRSLVPPSMMPAGGIEGPAGDLADGAEAAASRRVRRPR